MVEKGNGYKVGERNFETISDAIDYYQVGVASLLQTGKLSLPGSQEEVVHRWRRCHSGYGFSCSGQVKSSSSGNPVRRAKWELNHRQVTIIGAVSALLKPSAACGAFTDRESSEQRASFCEVI